MQDLSEPTNLPAIAASAELSREPLGEGARKLLSPEARRALAEADERRRVKAQQDEPHQKEINGRAGPEPVRYGDWEVKGIASDF